MHHAAFRSGFHLSPGPLAASLTAQFDVAARAAKGRWARDAATWSADPAVQLRKPDTSLLKRALGSLLDGHS
jgi:hypothetical protein